MTMTPPEHTDFVAADMFEARDFLDKASRCGSPSTVQAPKDAR